MTEKKSVDEIIEEAKTWIGKKTKPKTNKYPVEYEPIRRYCDMVDDENPLFLDPEYAKKTRYGGIPLPPFAPFGIIAEGSPGMLAKLTGAKKEDEEDTMMIMPPLPGGRFINMSQEWEWFKPAMVGDILTARTTLADVYVKGIKIDPKATWVINEMEFTNQKGEKVAVIRNILLSHRMPDEVAADNG